MSRGCRVTLACLVVVFGMTSRSLAGEMYQNDSGAVARAVRIEFSEPAEITSMWPSFPQREPHGPTTVVVLAGGEVPAGGWFSFTWQPDGAGVVKVAWLSDPPVTLFSLHIPVRVAGTGALKLQGWGSTWDWFSDQVTPVIPGIKDTFDCSPVYPLIRESSCEDMGTHLEKQVSVSSPDRGFGGIWFKVTVEGTGGLAGDPLWEPPNRFEIERVFASRGWYLSPGDGRPGVITLRFPPHGGRAVVVLDAGDALVPQIISWIVRLVPMGQFVEGFAEFLWGTVAAVADSVRQDFPSLATSWGDAVRKGLAFSKRLAEAFGEEAFARGLALHLFDKYKTRFASSLDTATNASRITARRLVKEVLHPLQLTALVGNILTYDWTIASRQGGYCAYGRCTWEVLCHSRTEGVPPVVTSLSVSPHSVAVGAAFTISFSVADSSGSGLKRVELYRANDANGSPLDWAEIRRLPVSGSSYSGSLTDVPASAGTYWYGLHVVDNAENWNDERNTHTGGAPGQYGPIMRVVSPPFTTHLTLTLYVHEGSASGPVIAGARVQAVDGAGTSFDQTTDSSGFVSITGAPGTWSFTVSKSGYQTNSWSRSITLTETHHGVLQRTEPPTNGCSVVVRPGESIQEAIDVAPEGAVICLEDGTWVETLSISKDLVLRGTTATGTMIVAPHGVIGPTIRIVGDRQIRVEIARLTAAGGTGTGIHADGHAHVSITSSGVLRSRYGIVLADSAQAAITDVIVSDNKEYGVHVQDSASATIQDCTIALNHYGILCGSSARVLIARCTFTQNRLGVRMLSSSDAIISDSHIIGSGEHGISIANTAHASIVDTRVEGSGHYGLDTTGSARCSVTRSLITANYGGVAMTDSSSVTLVDAAVQRNRYTGIRMLESAQMTLTSSVVEENGQYGIKMHGASRAVIMDSVITANTWEGIYLERSAHVVLRGNRITGNKGGVWIAEKGCARYLVFVFNGFVAGSANDIPGPDEPGGNREGAFCPPELMFLRTPEGGELDRRK